MEGPYRASGCPKRSPSKRTSFTGQDQSEDRPSFHLSDEKKGILLFFLRTLTIIVLFLTLSLSDF